MTEQERKARRQQELEEYQRIVSWQLSGPQEEPPEAALVRQPKRVRIHLLPLLALLLTCAGFAYFYMRIEYLSDQNTELMRQLSQNEISSASLKEEIDQLRGAVADIQPQEASITAEEQTSRASEAAQEQKEVSMSVIYPLRDSSIILHAFGPYEEEDGSHANCLGMDLGVGEGSEILASNNGMVSFAGEDDATGKTVKIDHGNGYESYYGYIGEILVSEGQKVNAGDAIAVTGTSENGICHLEFRISCNGNYVNPEQLLDIVG